MSNATTAATMSNEVPDDSGSGADDLDAVYQFLRREAAQRNMAATLLTQLARRQEPLLTLPVHLAGDDLDAYDIASQLQDLEDAWNNQEPRPRLRLFLSPVAR